MQGLVRRLASVFRGRARPPAVLFYASSLIDEVWIRTTALRMRALGVEAPVAVGGAPEAGTAAVAALYRDHGIQFIAQCDGAALKEIGATVVVSATNGLARSAFAESLRHLVHMPHSLVSLHMIYTADSFDGFDTLLACGPHQIAEFEALTRWRGLAPRAALPVGYGKLDLLLAGRKSQAAAPRRVLLAPSWGKNNLLNGVGAELVSALLDAGLQVVLRPHPLMILGADPVYLDLCRRYEGRPAFAIESPFDGDGAIFDAGVLVTDYSGIALEFASLRRRACVFADVPPKVVNPEWRQLGLEPVELALRSRLGEIAPPQPAAIRDAVLRVLGRVPEERIAAAEPSYLFNPGRCAEAAARAIAGLLSSVRATVPA